MAKKQKAVAPLLVLPVADAAIIDHAVSSVSKSALAFAKAQSGLNKKKDSLDGVMLNAIKAAYATFTENVSTLGLDKETAQKRWGTMLTAFLPDKRKAVCSTMSLFAAIEAQGGNPATLDNRAYRARIAWAYIFDHPDCKVPKKDKDGVTVVDGTLQSIETAVKAAKKAAEPQAQATGDEFEQMVASIGIPAALEKIAAILFTANATTAAAKQIHEVAIGLEKSA